MLNMLLLAAEQNEASPTNPGPHWTKIPTKPSYYVRKLNDMGGYLTDTGLVVKVGSDEALELEYEERKQLESQGMYIPECVVSVCRRRKKGAWPRQYVQVMWRGYPGEYTWEPLPQRDTAVLRGLFNEHQKKKTDCVAVLSAMQN